MSSRLFNEPKFARAAIHVYRQLEPAKTRLKFYLERVIDNKGDLTPDDLNKCLGLTERDRVLDEQTKFDKASVLVDCADDALKCRNILELIDALPCGNHGNGREGIECS